MTDKTPRPFLTFVHTPTCPFSTALPQLETPEVISPWSPKPAVELTSAPIGPTADDIAQLIDDAKAQGIAEGLAETAALRALLSKLVAELAAARAAIVEPTAETIADAACCVVEAWLGHADRSAVFLPVIRAWITQTGSPLALPAPGVDPTAPLPAIARVHPDDVAALTEAISDAATGAPIAVIGDPSLAPGAVELRGPAFELSHNWHVRLPELRAQILTALTGLDEGADDAQGDPA